MLRSKYIDTGKVRFVFREFPLDIKAAAASILARCIGKGDSEKYLTAVEMLFKLQDRLMAQTKETLIYVGRQHGMSEQDVKTCEEDQAQFDKLNADQQYAHREVKVDADFLSQRCTAAGLDVVRGAGRTDQAVAQVIAPARRRSGPCPARPPRR
jgi:protein-disulfide isomerase